MNIAFVTGTIITNSTSTTRSGDNWYKVLIEETETATRTKKAQTLEISFFGQAAKMYDPKDYPAGTIVSIPCKIVTREYNGKFYTDLHANGIVSTGYFLNEQKKEEEEKPIVAATPKTAPVQVHPYEVPNTDPYGDVDIIEDDLPF